MAPMEVVGEAPAGLFAQCVFVVICNGKFNESEAQKVVQTLRLHGAGALLHKSADSKLVLEGITHIVSATFDFPEYQAACDALIPVVKPGWVDASLMRNKLANPRQFNPDPRLFLSEVVVCCADLPDGDADAICGGVLAMGGLFTFKVTTQVTHLVALTMDSEKCAIIESKQLNIKIVLPHWFDDCLKIGRRIDEGPYLLPDPEILHRLHDSPPKALDKRTITGAVHPDPSRTSSPAVGPAVRGNLTIFRNKKVTLSEDLDIGTHLRSILETLIINGGGKLTEQVRKTDMYVCKFRQGEQYRTASRLGKDVGNLAWLYQMITNNVWTSPLRRLLHYPVACKGLPGFQSLRISLSNYSGEARVYLENLIMATGAECTKTLKQDNTHLITAHVMSEKCAAAKDWGIHLVNHLWLEESYARWKMQSVTNARYVHFPSRTNLGEVVGQTPIDRAALERNFFSDDDTDMPDAGELEVNLQNLPPPRVPQSASVDSPKEPRLYGKADSRNISGQTPNAAKGVLRLEEIRNQQTPGPSRFTTGKENETPSTTSSRKSKEAAVTKLQDFASDIALYEKERKRVGGVVYGGRRKTDEDRIVLSRKRSVEEQSDTDSTEENDPKRIKNAISSPAMYLLVSKYNKWVNQPKVEDGDKKQLRNMGIVVTADPSRATHLAAPSILRTPKFVSALAYAPIVLSTSFIDECLKRDELVKPEKHVLVDKVNEKKLGVSIALSRERAKGNRNQLLQGRTIYCMENIQGGFDKFEGIIKANGGQCNSYRGRPGTMVPSRRADSETSTTDEEGHNDVYLISGPEKENGKIWTRFRSMAEGSRKIPRILRADWLLETAMKQKVLPIGTYEIAGA